MIRLLLLLISQFVNNLGATDPCSTEEYLTIPNIGFRFVNYRIDENDIAFQDNQLEEGWYHVGNVTMPEHPPDDIFTCGTKFPVWLNGSHPVDNIPVTRTTCQLGVINDCDVKYNIRIQRCDGYFVYRLKATKSTKTGYCFGEGIQGSRPTYVASKPVVRTDRENTPGRNNRTITSTYFRCDFEESTGESLFYVVTWYMDNIQRYRTGYRRQATDPSLHVTEKKFITHGFRMGSDISCSVQAFLKRDSVPGKPSQMADNLFAGIKILTPTVDIYHGENDTSNRLIVIQPTIPIGCAGSNECTVNLLTYVPHDQAECTKLAFEESSCGVQLPSNNYSTRRTIKVVTSDTAEYYKTGSYQIFLKTTDTSENQIWKNYALPPIKVNIRLNQKDERVYEGKRCYSHNDPHMKTFDGCRYDNHQEGEYILYRNTNHKTEVQIKYRNCGSRRVSIWPIKYKPIKCNCGVAVKAGRDLFEADVCGGKVFIGYRSCDDEALSVKSDGAWKYRIFFTYGSYVEVNIDGTRERMNIDIIPSSHDEKVVYGLCGSLDGDFRNDFHYRPGEGKDPDGKSRTNLNGHGHRDVVTDYVWEFNNQPTEFIEQWKIRSEAENLFSTNRDKGNPWTFRACVCSEQTHNDTQGMDKISSYIPCNKNAVAECVGGKTVGEHVCSVYKSSRKRRSMRRNPIIPIVHLDKSRIDKRSVDDANMTTDEAKQYCQDQIGSTDVFSLCSTVPSVDTNGALNTCIADIMLTGSEEWTQATKESMQDACLSELRRNTTLREAQGNKPSIAEQIQDIACQNNCSSAGICVKGVCKCNEGYGTSDCSIDIRKGPTISGLLDHGMCDEKDLPCDHAYVFGSIFTDSGNLTCRLEEFVISSGGEMQQTDTYFVPGEFETFVETICPLQTTRRKRSLSMKGNDAFVTGYNISVSNDGNAYGDGTELFIYDSTCQIMTNTSNKIHFTLQDGFCFIDNTCVSGEDINPADKCLKCDVAVNTRSWAAVVTTECQKLNPDNNQSGDVSKEKTNDDGEGSNYLWVIGVVAGVLVGVVIGTVVVVKLTKNRGKRVSDSSVSLRQTQIQRTTNPDP